MTKQAKFLVAVLLIASALFALRFCYPHSGPLDEPGHAIQNKPHHACGYKLANDGHDTRAIQAYLGHRNIQNTTRYTALAPPQRFKEFFRD